MSGIAIALRGRAVECARLDQLAEAVQAGRSQVLVLRGEPGVGKTALLDHVRESATEFRLLRAAGVESEMELPFAGLHQLCAPLLDRLDRLPAPQRAALATAFGLDDAAPPDRFLVALAVLSLLADAADDGPVMCIVDDAQWLDRVSAQTLAFVARRVLAEQLALVFAVRDGSDDEFGGLPALAVRGLERSDARALLDSVLTAPLDGQIRERIVAETRGNPLALLELTHGLTPRELAGGFGLLDTVPLSGRIEAGFAARLADLTPDARRAVLAAAADPVGDPILLWRALELLDVDREAAGEVEAAGLVELGAQVTFRHPLVRSATYRSASAEERSAVHRALADATDPDVDPDRRAWHRAAAALGPDAEVALELERSAGRAQARGGLAAAAAFLQRAVTLTDDPALRADRALAAALASLHAGAFDAAVRLVTLAEGEPLDELQQARADLLRGQIAFAANVGRDAPPLLLRAAARLEPLDVELARETYLDAWGAALFAGSLASGGTLTEVSEAATAAPSPGDHRPADLLLDSLATLVTGPRAAAAPGLRRAANTFAGDEHAAEANFRWGWLTTIPSNLLWDDATWHAINTRQLRRAREVGALVRLPIDLTAHAILLGWWGDFVGAESAIAEVEAVTEATGARFAPFGAMFVAALRGDESEARSLIDGTTAAASAGGQGIGVQFAQWTAAILFNGLGRHDDALAAAREATEGELELFLADWSLPELVEAAAKSGERARALEACARLADAASAAGSDWALGVAARSRALLEPADAAEDAFREAIERLARTRFRTELARAHLLYGEWLTGEDRRAEARVELHVAHDLLHGIGMEAFAERARMELVAAGETVRRRVPDDRALLTAQEAQIARLAQEGLSNPEIGAQLYLSHRTVEWHLHKVFTKLGVRSRRDLRRVGLDPNETAVPA